jgi:hypothetical protein
VYRKKKAIKSAVAIHAHLDRELAELDLDEDELEDSDIEDEFRPYETVD